MVQELSFEPRKIRIKFVKLGALKFISHLDLCRTMQSALLRAGIPIYYSEGFNPRPKMVFSLPLSIGASSVCEYMDIKLTNDMDNSEVLRRLSAALTDELAPVEVYDPETKFTEIAWARYRITLYGGDGETVLRELLTHPLVVKKHTKRGECDTDILPGIGAFSFSEDDGALLLDVCLRADSANYTNPEHIVHAMKNQPDDYRIERTAVLLEDGVSDFR